MCVCVCVCGGERERERERKRERERVCVCVYVWVNKISHLKTFKCWYAVKHNKPTKSLVKIIFFFYHFQLSCQEIHFLSCRKKRQLFKHWRWSFPLIFVKHIFISSKFYVSLKNSLKIFFSSGAKDDNRNICITVIHSRFGCFIKNTTIKIRG